MDKFLFHYIFIAVVCTRDIWCKNRDYHGEGKIVGGNETTIQAYPYQAYLLLFDGRDYYQCGGSIVSSNYVVTAAHCLSSIQKIFVRIGSTNADSGGTQYETTSFYTHPKYNSVTSDYDAGVVRVEGGMNLDGTDARAISMVGAGYDPRQGENMIATGWGTTTENGNTSTKLRAVQVPVVGRTRCNRLLRANITSRMICAGVTQGGKDTCQGDSGGPAVVKSSGKLAGITSFGFGCARPFSPGVYALVGNDEIRSFLRNITSL